jgi:TPR repeat protein
MTEAQYMVGESVREGWGVKKDGAEALVWYLKAAKKGHPGAQLMAAYVYLSGEGWRAEPQKAVVWAELARVNGEQQASSLLALAGKKLGSAELSEAMQQAGLCLQSVYRECPE